jgi:hypothetical protein
MAYTNKYKITFATKSGVNSYVYLLEEGYLGDLIEYPAISVLLEYIPKSDDIYEPIVVSQLSVTIDITDNIDNMPNFTTLNDRKYLVKLFSDTNLEWQGWALSDNVNISYTTGRKELSFNAIDGLGMLESIPFQLPENYRYINTRKLLTILLDSLSFIQFPTGLNVLSGISYFSNGMSNRTALGSNETLNQTYVRLTTLLDNDLQPLNCFEILSNIAKSFGSRIFQAEGLWFIVPLNEFANDYYYYTIYNTLGAVVSFGQRSKTITIQEFTNNTSGAYFIDNSQYKLLKKGYNKISIDKKIEYPSNYITNYNLQNYVDNTALAWTNQISGGQILIKKYTNAELNSFILYKNGGSTDYVYVSPQNLPSLSYLDNIEISFNILDSGGFGITENNMYVKIMLDNGYFWSSDEKWVNAGSTGSVFYSVKNDGQITINCIRVPFNSSLTIQFYLGVIDGVSSSGWVEINNFALSITERLINVTIDSYFTNSNDYVYELDLPYGFNSINIAQYYYNGFLCNSNGDSLYNWYNQRTSSVIYNSLAELIINAYSNSLIKNVINVDSSFFAVPADTTIKLNNSTLIKMTDTNIVNSVQDKSYIIGNSTINLVNNESQSTLLELEKNSTATTIDINYTIETQGSPYPVKRSLPKTTRPAAVLADLTDNILYILGQSSTAYAGAKAYTDQYCSVLFNGNNAWYKVQSENLINYRIYFIAPNGVCYVNDPR